MKTSLKIGGRIFLLILALLIAYVVSFGIIMISFIIIQKVLIPLQNVDMKTFRSAILIILGIICIYIFLWFTIKPILYVSKWIQRLSEGSFQELVTDVFLIGRDSFFYKSRYCLYKELLLQMQTLTDKLKQSEKDRQMLEKNRREWLSGITHDLKTPLSYIHGYASMIAANQYEWSVDEIKDFGFKIEEKSSHIKKLIDDLNTSFQSENGKVSIQKTRIEMAEFLRNIVLDTANSPRSANYVFSYETELEKFFLDVDTALLQRALQNILVNAITHNPIGTEIHVSVQIYQRIFRIEVIDNGIGMTEETLKNLFESYYRGTSTEYPTEGTGLGMAIAKQFIELHDGSVFAESTPEHGTCIRIDLPLP